MRSWIFLGLVLLSVLTSTNPAFAGQLAQRLATFPAWDNKPAVQSADGGDLVYPDWMAGTWQVTSTLEDLVAPLAPEIVTPGFEDNRQYLHQPVRFQVRFVPRRFSRRRELLRLFQTTEALPIVADREFNGLNIGQAYLGDAIYSVRVDPEDPNRQITRIAGDNVLISTVTGRASEMPSPNRFIATEITQQVFRSPTQVYLNEVETTTEYLYLDSGKIEATQITAVYLSPQDPNYFRADGSPVALYRYRLELVPVRE